MTFSDDDLKRLKEDLAKGGWSPKMSALLARLEAAEDVCTIAEADGYPMGAIKDWRKAAGKE